MGNASFGSPPFPQILAGTSTARLFPTSPEKAPSATLKKYLLNLFFLFQTLPSCRPSSKGSSVAPLCSQQATTMLPQSEFAHGRNTRLPKNTQLGELDMLLPPTERGKEGTPSWHHSDTLFPSFRMNAKVRAYFTELGSSHVGTLGFRDNWVFLGAKGLMNKSPFEKVHGPPLP